MTITAFATGLRRLGAHALALTICALALITTSACSDDNSASQSTTTQAQTTTTKVTPSIVLKVGYENKPGEPFDIGMKRWKQ